MKTKKFLAVMLALVMMVGLFAFPTAFAKDSAADYTDADDITKEFVEAIDVLTALGVIQGNPDDSLDPQGKVNRAMAAVIAANLALGPAVAAKLPAGETGFSDVDGTTFAAWASGAIAWAVQEGYIVGYGDGKYGPADEVTSVQFAILLLQLLGYGKNNEYKGPQWATNGALDGMRFGILDLDGVLWSDPATREQMMHYALNALLTYLVDYNAFMGIYYYLGTNPLQNEPGKITLGGQVFNLNTRNAGDDPLGFPQRNYLVGNRVIAGPYANPGSVLGSGILVGGGAPAPTKASLRNS